LLEIVYSASLRCLLELFMAITEMRGYVESPIRALIIH
jgi:hypothetical protein